MDREYAHRVARTVGGGFARIQHGLDKLFEFGFEKMQKTGNTTKPPKKNENKYMAGAKRAGKETVSFLGALGEGFYKRYEQLKREDP